MKISQIELMLENGDILSCAVGGQGSRIGYLVGGPGSFYLNGLSHLGNIYTLVSYDAWWTDTKDQSYHKKDLSVITKETIKKQDHEIILALKHHFGVATIDGFGFSAPGALLFEEALEHPENFDRIIGTGIGLTALDPTFTKTNSLFYQLASPRRKKAFETYQKKYKELQESLKEDSREDSKTLEFFDLKSKEKLKKPHKQFLAETISITPKILFNYENQERSKSIILSHWKKNPFRARIDKKFQEHFFNTIYQEMRPLLTLIMLSKIKSTILLIYGESDYITPLPEHILNILTLYRTITILIMQKCAHMPYIESPREYASIINEFLSCNKIKIDYSKKLIQSRL